MGKIIGRDKADVVYIGALNNTNATSEYVDVRGYGKLMFVVGGAALAATKTTTVLLKQATDSAGTGAANLAVSATKTLTANTNVNGMTFDLTSVANTDVVTINGVSFTKAAGTSVANATFADGAGLVTLINGHGVLGDQMVASGTTTVTVKTKGHNFDITGSVTNVAGTITPATLYHELQVEVDGFDLNLAGGFYYVAANIATTGNSTFTAVAIRSDNALEPVTQMGEQFAG